LSPSWLRMTEKPIALSQSNAFRGVLIAQVVLQP
jgi:hypothetical protein